jgi:16S rRNA (guanine527-N7)-methyltransferase
VSDPARPGRAALGALDPLLLDAPALAVSLPAAWSAAAAAFVDLLLAANEHRNLTRVVEPAAVARDHLLDAIAALPRLDALAPASVMDIGSGGGIPALPLALARPTLHWTLVEATRSKAAFLREAATTLGLSNVDVLAERAEDVGRDAGLREAADLVIARACAPLPVLAELALPLLRVGGMLLAWKGPLAPEDEEVVRGAAASALLGGDRPTIISAGHPALGGRTFVTIRKLRQTDERYPRRAGQPARRPLG